MFKVGDVVQLSDNDINKGLDRGSGFDLFLLSSKYFTVREVASKNIVRLDENRSGYDVLRFELSKSAIINQILSEI